MIKAVLFDFDGVIANTLEYHVQAWQKAFHEFNLNVSVTLEDISIQEGSGASDIAKILAHEKKLKLSQQELEQITQLKREFYGICTKATIYPEIQQFINKLKTMPLKLALVTGSIMKSIKKVVDDDFLDTFSVIVTQYDVTHTKPDPEPFLKAAQKLQIPPDQCLVIENAPKGVQAAKDAGMICIALKTTISDDNILKKADYIFNNASEIDIESILLT